MTPPETIGLVALGIAGFVALWLANCALISRISRWQRLASEFRVSPGSDLAPQIRPYVAWMRFHVRYDNVMHIDGDPEGLSLSVMFLFNFQHPPLRIPWDQIEVQNFTFLGLFSGMKLLLGREARIPLSFYNREARELVAQYANRSLLQNQS